MTELVRPFAALRPAPPYAADVVAPPYDVLNSEEARERAAGKPYSFLHVSRAEIDLPADTDAYDPEVYAKAAQNLEQMIASGVLIREAQSCYYVYRARMGERQQTGIALTASLNAYAQDRVRRHEHTRPTKEDDRVRQIDVLNAQTGPVMLIHQRSPVLSAIIDAVTRTEPLYALEADDGVEHTVWRINEQKRCAEITGAFEALGALYIADGHHRSASAARVAAARASADDQQQASHDYFLAVSFPEDEVNILDYNRVVADLNGKSPPELIAEIEQRFSVTSREQPVRPDRPGRFGMYLDGSWFQLDIDPARIPQDQPVARLDANLLIDHLIGPLLDVSDPRTDARIDFVGGIRGLEELERRVDANGGVAFAVYPISVADLMTVADAGEVMPPKVTWFEPKLADGLLSHVLD